MRIAYFDLESTSLDGDLGYLLIGSILSSDSGEIVSLRQDRLKPKNGDMADDARLATKIRDALESHDMIVAWYGKGFDIPFLNTRLIRAGERRMKSLLTLDPCWFFKGWRGLKPANAKLRTVAEFFGLDEQKMEVSREVWARAASGNRAALDILVDRCESDVRILKRLTDLALKSGVVKRIEVYP